MENNNCNVLKSFVVDAKEYMHKRNEAICVKLQRYLQALTATPDSNVFDPNTVDGAEFFISLFDLMSVIESRSGLMWCAVDTLGEAAKNPAAQYSLIHKFKFTPILAEVLNTYANSNKRIQVLRLLQNCTYGVKIQWQEAYLPVLLSTLIKWTTNTEKNNELVSLSLGVLINLCYKNPPAIFALKRVIDVRELVKAVLALPRDILDIRVRAYKLMLILDELEGELPDSKILSGVKWTFKRLRESFESKNSNMMRHIVDYFRDIQCNKNFRRTLLTYESLMQDIETLVKLLELQVEVLESSECVAILLEFIEYLLELNLPDMEKGFNRLMKIALNLVGINTHIGRCTFQIVRTAVTNLSDGTVEAQTALHKQLEDYLQTVLALMEKWSSTFDSRRWMIDLLSLLLEMSKIPSLRSKIVSSLNILSIKNLFNEVISPGNSENLFDNTLSALCIQGIGLVLYLSKSCEAWRDLWNELMQCKKLQTRLAASLYIGDKNIKLLVLQLLMQINDNSTLNQISQCLTDLSTLLVPTGSLEQNGRSTGLSYDHFSANSNRLEHIAANGPLFPVDQMNQLDKCVNTINDAIAKNELTGIGTNSVLELYRFQVASLSHTQSVLENNLQIVDTHCTQLRHRMAYMTAHINRFLSLLHAKELCVEDSKKLVSEYKNELSKMEKALHSARGQHAHIIEELKESQMLNNELTKKIDTLHAEIEEVKAFNSALMANNETMVSQIRHHTEKQKGLEERICSIQKELENRDDTIRIKEKEISRQNHRIEDLEESIRSKDLEIEQYQSEISVLEEVKDLISRGKNKK